MRIYNELLCEKPEPEHVMYAFSSGYNVVSVTDTSCMGSSYFPNVIMGVKKALFNHSDDDNVTFFHKDDSDFVGAYGFHDTGVPTYQTFVLYAYMLYKYRWLSSAFREEFEFISRRVTVDVETDARQMLSLRQWFRHIKSNKMSIILDLCAGTIGIPNYCLFQNPSLKRKITSALDNATVVIKVGDNIVTKGEVGTSGASVLASFLEGYQPKWYQYFTRIFNRQCVAGTVASAAHTYFTVTTGNNSDFLCQFVQPVLSAYAEDTIKLDPKHVSSVVKKRGDKMGEVVVYVPTLSKDHCCDVVALKEMKKTLGFDLKINTLVALEPYNFKIKLAENSENNKFDCHTKDQLLDLIQFLDAHGMQANLVVSARMGHSYIMKHVKYFMVSPASMKRLQQRLDDDISQIHIIAFTTNDLKKVNLLKLKGFDIEAVHLNLARVSEARRALSKNKKVSK